MGVKVILKIKQNWNPGLEVLIFIPYVILEETVLCAGILGKDWISQLMY